MLKSVGTLGVALVIVVALGGCASANSQVRAAKPVPPIQAAVQKCSPFKTGDSGHSVTLDGQGKSETSDSTKVSTEQYVCILAALKAPDFVIAKMDATRALDGMQNAEWAGISATWTYHPDNGLDLILHDKG
jgi:hypothetical protein